MWIEISDIIMHKVDNDLYVATVLIMSSLHILWRWVETCKLNAFYMPTYRYSMMFLNSLETIVTSYFIKYTLCLFYFLCFIHYNLRSFYRDISRKSCNKYVNYSLIDSIKILKIDFTKLFKKKNKFKIGD